MDVAFDPRHACLGGAAHLTPQEIVILADDARMAEAIAQSRASERGPHLLSICDRDRAAELRDLCKTVLRLENRATKIARLPAGSFAWLAETRLFWELEADAALVAADFRQRRKAMSLRFHENKLGPLVRASTMEDEKKKEVLKFFGQVVEPLFASVIAYLSPDAPGCPEPHDVKNVEIERDGDLVIRLTCAALPTDKDARGVGNMVMLRESVVTADIPGVTDNDDETLTFDFIEEPGRKFRYRGSLVMICEDEVEVTLQKEPGRKIGYRGSLVMMCEDEVEETSQQAVAEQVFCDRLRGCSRVATLLVAVEGWWAAHNGGSKCAASLGGDLGDIGDGMLSSLQPFFEINIEEKIFGGFGVDLPCSDYPWLFAPRGAYRCTLRRRKAPEVTAGGCSAKVPGCRLHTLLSGEQHCGGHADGLGRVRGAAGGGGSAGLGRGRRGSLRRRGGG